MAKYRCFSGRCRGGADGNPWIGDESQMEPVGTTTDLGEVVSVLRAPCGHEGTLRRFLRLPDDYELRRFRFRVARTKEYEVEIDVLAPSPAVGEADARELATEADQEWVETRSNVVVLGFREIKDER